MMLQQRIASPSNAGLRAKPMAAGLARPRPVGTPGPSTTPATHGAPLHAPAPGPRRAAPVVRSGMFSDPIVARPPKNPDPSLFNEDFSPTTPEKRTFDTVDFATFWITLVISIT